MSEGRGSCRTAKWVHTSTQRLRRTLRFGSLLKPRSSQEARFRKKLIVIELLADQETQPAPVPFSVAKIVGFRTETRCITRNRGDSKSYDFGDKLVRSLTTSPTSWLGRSLTTSATGWFRFDLRTVPNSAFSVSLDRCWFRCWT